MEPKANRDYIAFADNKKIASGDIIAVALKVKKYTKNYNESSILVFDQMTSHQVELDLRGTDEEVERRLTALLEPEEKKCGPGRPKLGVVSKEVTLLPQHWEWLALQPGGASVTLRKLIEEAKKKNSGKDQIRQAQDAAYKFMHAIAGDFSNYEEALRALYAADFGQLQKMISDWPKDIQKHILDIIEGIHGAGRKD